MGALSPGGFPRGDDSDHAVTFAIAMRDDKHSERGAQAEEGEPILVGGMIGVDQEDSLLVCEDSLGFVERDAMLSDVLSSLCGVPLEAKVIHAVSYVHRTYNARSHS